MFLYFLSLGGSLQALGPLLLVSGCEGGLSEFRRSFSGRFRSLACNDDDDDDDDEEDDSYDTRERMTMGIDRKYLAMRLRNCILEYLEYFKYGNIITRYLIGNLDNKVHDISIYLLSWITDGLKNIFF